MQKWGRSSFLIILLMSYHSLTLPLLVSGTFIEVRANNAQVPVTPYHTALCTHFFYG